MPCNPVTLCRNLRIQPRRLRQLCNSPARRPPLHHRLPCRHPKTPRRSKFLHPPNITNGAEPRERTNPLVCSTTTCFNSKQLILLHMPIAHLRSRTLGKPISLLSLSQYIARIYQVGRAEIQKYRNLTLALSTTSDSDGKITYKRKR
jgi:hypothetical protein